MESCMNGSESAGELRWYLIQCKPRQDARALENLERQDFTCYRPMRAVARYRDGRTRADEESLFPGYLFIRLDRLTNNWHAINSTRGVHKIVRFDGYPVPVPDKLIDSIRARLAESLATEPYLKPGDRVRIEAGAFAQTEAIFLVDDGDHRVVLLLNILQTEQRLSFPLESVRRVC